MKVLVACEVSGVVRDAFRNKGHDAYSCDVLPSDSQYHIQGEVFAVLGSGWDLMIAHPPCTALCVTGNRHYAGTQLRDDAFNFFMKLYDAPIPKICIENPVGVVSSMFRKPDQYIQPYQYGHNVSKKTGLWLKNLPLLVSAELAEVAEVVVFPSGKKMSRWFYDTSLLPQNERAGVRSVTFQGIADAMAGQWVK